MTDTVVYGIDVSSFQKGLKLADVKKQGYSFVYAKVTEGQGYVDPLYADWYSQAKAEELLFSAYHFVRSDSTARNQALNIAKNIKDHTVPIILDIEPSGTSHPTLGVANDIAHELATLGLRTAGAYLPRFYWKQLGSPDLRYFGSVVLLNAEYGNNPAGYGSAIYPGNSGPGWVGYGNLVPTVWQFSSKGKVDGYSGNVDVNAFRGSLADLRKHNIFKDFAPIVVPTPATTPDKPVSIQNTVTLTCPVCHTVFTK